MHSTAPHSEHGFNWLSMIPGIDAETLHLYNHVIMAIIVVVAVLIAAFIARLQLMAALKREDQAMIPDSKVTFRNFFEIIAEKIYNLAEQVMGKSNAHKYFPIVGAHFAGPILWLAPLMLVVELASHVFRPISLALRLRGNIMGDHIVLGIFNNLTPFVLPLVFYAIGLFVCFIQAFVFCLMTMVYISLSATHDHEHEF